MSKSRTEHSSNAVPAIHSVEKPSRILCAANRQLLLQDSNKIRFLLRFELAIVDRVVVIHREYKLVLHGDRQI